ncbi:MAG TPA: CBS domain-containing protein [Pyrinomonadaceae bacterium]|jgi:CBS domain-containing protein|nr:CBS domain-containing protein [Pyrinomonadaceae bacterium]
MARYRNDLDEDRDYYRREERMRRDTMGAFDEPYSSRNRFEQDWRPDYNRGSRFGERAEYETDEPRYSEQRGRFRDEGRRSSLYDVRGDLSTNRWREREYRGSERTAERSRLRCRDIMTRDLAVATRDTAVVEVALMMKQEDTGVIPVVEYDVTPGNGRSENDRQANGRNYSRGKLLGLITDRDIVIRAVAEGKDCTQVRAQDIMTVDVYTAHPNDRVVDVIHKMGQKQVRRIPVCNENGYLVGMISMADVAVETREDQELADALEEISKGTSFWNRIFG